MKDENTMIAYFFSSFLSLSIGFWCYFYFRDTDMLFFKIFDIKMTFMNTNISSNFILYFLRYNLSDGLWLLSGILFLRFIWVGNYGICKNYILVFVGVALLMELLQLIDSVPGTFDMMDLFTMASFALLEQCINIFFTKQRRFKKEYFFIKLI